MDEIYSNPYLWNKIEYFIIRDKLLKFVDYSYYYKKDNPEIKKNILNFIRKYKIVKIADYKPNYISKLLNIQKTIKTIHSIDHLMWFIDINNNYVIVNSPYNHKAKLPYFTKIKPIWDGAISMTAVVSKKPRKILSI